MNARFEEIKERLIFEGEDEDNIRERKGIVLSAAPYNVDNNAGVTLQYLYSKNLDPRSVPNSRSKGIKVGKNSVGPEEEAYLFKVPGYYNLLTRESMGANMNQQTKVIAVEYLGTVETIIHEIESPAHPEPSAAPVESAAPREEAALETASEAAPAAEAAKKKGGK